ncbi:MAG: DM13 domain-containing protein [Chloroflexota bacterium]
MSDRLRLLILLVGAVLVVATFTYPLWREPPEGEVASDLLPELSSELQDAFLALPRSVRTSYQLMSEENPSMAVTLLEARLNPPEPAVQSLPELSTAQQVATADVQTLSLSEDDPPDRELQPYNNIFSASGELTIYEYPDGRYVFQLENLNVINGPDLWAVLSTEARPFSREEFGRDFIELAPLPSNTGNMNFEIRDIDLSLYNSLVIFDRRYGFIFAVAPFG